MTNEEAIKEFESELKWAELNTYPYVSKQKVEADKMAIKALEEESVLDKIRAEIKEKFEGCDICEWFEDYDYEENDISEYQYVGDVSDILAIIDKYKAESEDKEVEE